jgi:hypothetical protein
MTNMYSIHHPALVQSPTALSWQARYGRRLNPSDVLGSPLMPQFAGSSVDQSVLATDATVESDVVGEAQRQADMALLAQVTAQAVSADAARARTRRTAMYAAGAVLLLITMMGGD